MSTIYTDLLSLEKDNKAIRVGIIGAGQMGFGMAAQLSTVMGMRLSGICDHNLYKAEEAAETYFNLSVHKDKEKMPIATDDYRDLLECDEIDLIVEATGSVNGGAEIAQACLDHNKHMVLLNVELDIAAGPILYKLFQEKNLIYTGSEGDEPAETFKLYEFAKSMGMEVLVIGKGKNNKVDFEANPETCEEEAKSKRMNPRMLASFKDGSKTMAEMNLLANATGFVPDIAGMHGVSGDIQGTVEKLRLKEEGGVLNSYGVVEYVDGIAPGVFAIVRGQNEFVEHELNYMLKEDGDRHILYRPFHLGSLETVMTIAKACLYGIDAIIPLHGQVCDTVAVAKKDLVPGEKLDGMGGFCLRGQIEKHEITKKERHIPIGLIAGNTVCKRPVKKGQILTLDDVDIDKSTNIYKLRERQDRELG